MKHTNLFYTERLLLIKFKRTKRIHSEMLTENVQLPNTFKTHD